MGFSAPEWLASFVLDALIKFVVIIVVYALANIGPPPHPSILYPSIFLAVGFCAFHFGCLVLGCAAAAAFERAGIELRPRFKFLLGILFANVLFAAILNTGWALEYTQAGRSIFELSPPTVAFVATNLLSVGAVYVCDRARRHP